MSIDVNKIMRTINTKGFEGGASSPASMIGQLGASLIPTTDKYGNVKKGGTIASTSLQMAGMGAQFGPIGAGVGAIVGAGAGLIKANQLLAEQKEKDTLARDLEKKNFMQGSRAILSSYPRSGVEVGGFYGKSGGKIGSNIDNFLMDGGFMEPLAEGISITRGRTHEQGGINFYDRGMNKFAELEDQEVVKGTKVYSDTLRVPSYVMNALKSKKK